MTETEILIEGVMIGIEGNDETWTIEIKDRPEMIEMMTAEDQVLHVWHLVTPSLGLIFLDYSTDSRKYHISIFVCRS